MIRVAKVKDNKDPKQLGRVKVEIIPELQTLSEDLLPWANPVQNFDASVDFSQNVPDKDSYIIVDVNDTWTHFSYDLTKPFSDKEEGMKAAYDFLKNNLELYTAEAPEPVKLEYSSTPEYLKFEDKTNGQLGIIFSNGRYLFWSGKDDKKIIFGYKSIKYMEILENGSFTFLLNKDDEEYSKIQLDESGNFNLTTDIQKPEGKKHTLDMKADGSFKFTNNQSGNKAGFIEYAANGTITAKNNQNNSSFEINSSSGDVTTTTNSSNKLVLKKSGELIFTGPTAGTDHVSLFTQIDEAVKYLLGHTHNVSYSWTDPGGSSSVETDPPTSPYAYVSSKAKAN